MLLADNRNTFARVTQFDRLDNFGSVSGVLPSMGARNSNNEEVHLTRWGSKYPATALFDLCADQFARAIRKFACHAKTTIRKHDRRFRVVVRQSFCGWTDWRARFLNRAESAGYLMQQLQQLALFCGGYDAVSERSYDSIVKSVVRPDIGALKIGLQPLAEEVNFRTDQRTVSEDATTDSNQLVDLPGPNASVDCDGLRNDLPGRPCFGFRLGRSNLKTIDIARREFAANCLEYIAHRCTSTEAAQGTDACRQMTCYRDGAGMCTSVPIRRAILLLAASARKRRHRLDRLQEERNRLLDAAQELKTERMGQPRTLATRLTPLLTSQGLPLHLVVLLLLLLLLLMWRMVGVAIVGVVGVVIDIVTGMPIGIVIGMVLMMIMSMQLGVRRWVPRLRP